MQTIPVDVRYIYIYFFYKDFSQVTESDIEPRLSPIIGLAVYDGRSQQVSLIFWPQALNGDQHISLLRHAMLTCFK